MQLGNKPSVGDKAEAVEKRLGATTKGPPIGEGKALWHQAQPQADRRQADSKVVILG